jgi:hypothetical protein
MDHIAKTLIHSPLACKSPAPFIVPAPSGSIHSMTTRSRARCNHPNPAPITHLTTKQYLPMLNQPLLPKLANNSNGVRLSQELNVLAKNETWILIPSTPTKM